MGSLHDFFQFLFMMFIFLIALGGSFVLAIATLNGSGENNEYYHKGNSMETYEIIDIDISNNTLIVENDEEANSVRADSETLTDYSIGDEIKLVETDRGFYVVEKNASDESYLIVTKKIRDKVFVIVNDEIQYEVSMTTVINEEYNAGDEIELIESNGFFFYNNERLEIISESSLMKPETID